VGQKGKKPITIASGSGNAIAGKGTTVKVKPSKKGKALKKKLKGKRAKLTVTIDGVSTTVEIKLG
ncbi:MAG: hypothetical protein Q7T55_15370, partial [Solirubrobacteraceae bacterium]|nr:hypothetical protein [Solirubrobacteraceae bacterium]